MGLAVLVRALPVPEMSVTHNEDLCEDSKMDIPLKAKVECGDGLCGESTAVIVDPLTKKMTHFVVYIEEIHPPPERLVPVGLVMETTPELIRLDCTRDEVARMAPFIATRYIPKDQPDYSMYQGGEASTEWYQPYATTTVGTPYTEVVEELVPEGEQALHRGARVEASDGHVGLVGELVVDESGSHITHLVLQEGHLWGKREVTLPLSAIERVEGDTVTLELDKKAIGQLPAIPLRRSYVKGEAGIELLVKVFYDPSGANEALESVEELNRRHTIKVLNVAVLVKDADGEVSLKETGDLDAKQGRLFGAITGGLIGLVAGPAGAVIGALAGAGAGGFAAKRIDMGLSDEFLKGFQERLQPGSSALVVLVEHKWAQSLSDVLGGLEGITLQQTLTDEMVQQVMNAGETQE
jgi:uncharacterized membrane protein